MEENEIKNKFKDLEAKYYEQEHRLFPIWFNFFTKSKFSKNDKRRVGINKAVIWSLIPKPTVTFVAISGLSLLTLFLAYEANVKLENQNTLLLVQNELQESQRRASLNIEISSIMQQINIEREKSNLKSLKDSQHKKKGHKVAPYTLSDITAARIASISRSLRPYRILKTDRVDLNSFSVTDFWDEEKRISSTKRLKTSDFLETEIRSPEREQLMTALATMRISFSNIGRNSNFDFCRFNDFDFSKGDLRTIRMSNSSLNHCNLSYTIFDYGILKGTNFNSIYGTSLSFIGSELNNSNFSYASINNTSFENANLTNVNFIIIEKFFFIFFVKISKKFRSKNRSINKFT